MVLRARRGRPVVVARSMASLSRIRSRSRAACAADNPVAPNPSIVDACSGEKHRAGIRGFFLRWLHFDVGPRRCRDCGSTHAERDTRYYRCRAPGCNVEELLTDRVDWLSTAANAIGRVNMRPSDSTRLTQTHPWPAGCSSAIYLPPMSCRGTGLSAC